MAKRKSVRPPRARRARPLLVVAAGLSLSAAASACYPIIGNPGCGPDCGVVDELDLSVPQPPPDTFPSDDDGGEGDGGAIP